MTAGPANGSTLEVEGDETNAWEVVVDALSGSDVKVLDGWLASEPSEFDWMRDGTDVDDPEATGLISRDEPSDADAGLEKESVVEDRFEFGLDGEDVDTGKECVLVASGAEFVSEGVVPGDLVEEVVGSGF